MSEFKVGDRVIRTGGTVCGVTNGRSYVVTETGNFSIKVEGLVSWFSTSYFKLYEEEQEMKSNIEQFDMKTQPWYIRVNNEEEFNLVQEWLKDNFGKCLNQYFKKNNMLLTNLSSNLGITDEVFWANNMDYVRSLNPKEIKFNLKIVIDSVVFPTVESEKDKQIRELQNTIELAQKQINRLKEMK